MSSSKLEEEASAIVITSDDTWVALINSKKYHRLARMLTKSGLLMHRLFSLPNISGSMISCGPCFKFRRLTIHEL